eukprot:CAMPEP_0116843110 /NCGR_PEP_ID=MMETSP0418-20121206/11902_1 /TAXON_ID=1158023 /ORGANISM="Astrosyne radiata, Strain 13vi08-1A" /LENGTH=515 /DNA_ID=CAMNT_0004473819 /DNA_START=106 /DNA_END=1654 /DNA_ORIENTATION=-
MDARAARRPKRVLHKRIILGGKVPTPHGMCQVALSLLTCFALVYAVETSLLHSEGEIRFLVLKRAMDLLYASVGVAVEVTGSESSSVRDHVRRPWQLPLATIAAASYYSLVGPSQRAAEAVTKSSQELIQNAWGMVSLSSIKLLSLRASRLLKGAALAERVTIAGVACFILSKDPCPDISAALKRHERQQNRRALFASRLSTIDERSERAIRRQQPSASQQRCKRNVIMHLTGGGFFAHTIASDLPYLLDWSTTTGAVVVCPEYALLPQHCFPDALEQVCAVYCCLIGTDCTEASVILGCQVDRIVVTGESAGGNLAAALCVKLCMEQNAEAPPRFPESRCNISPAGDDQHEGDPTNTTFAVHLPHALMLSCPALDLSLELSPSRVIGEEDPVLPSGLLSAISDAYLPCGSTDKKDPMASPLFAPDEVLKRFPPTLMFGSSEDPLLDDSVEFNQRLRCLGVPSELRATHHVPHAYWGLGTAGFPEAKQVQLQCETFLQGQFHQHKRTSPAQQQNE